MKGEVSVIIPSYNLKQYLGEALQSVKDQTYRNWECIIVDDGSTDGSIELAREWASRDSRFILIEMGGGGVCHARNRGVAAAEGEYIIFLDSDDILMPRCLEMAVDVLDHEHDAVIVYGKAEQFGKGVKTKILDTPPFSMETMLGRNCIYVTAMVRADDFRAAGGFSPDMEDGLEDWDLWLGILEGGGTVRQLDEVFFRYRIRKDSRNKQISDERLSALRRKIWEHHSHLYSHYFLDPRESVEYKRVEYRCNKWERFPGIRIYRFFQKLLKCRK